MSYCTLRVDSLSEQSKLTNEFISIDMCHTVSRIKMEKTVIFSTMNGILTKFSDSHDQTWYTNPQNMNTNQFVTNEQNKCGYWVHSRESWSIINASCCLLSTLTQNE